MRTVVFALLLVFSFSFGYGQDIAGDWNGVLKVGEGKLRLVLHVSKADTGFKSTLDSPDQGALGIPVTRTIFENSELHIAAASLNLEYKGTMIGDSIKGSFRQGGMELPLDLVRGVKKVLKRSQEPIGPYSYHTEDIMFKNPIANISLAGTLSLPKTSGKYPAVVLISGSGPQNRDEELVGHKPFLVIADHLTKNGIAVLRFDDRGVAKSEGNFKKATIDDFTSDVESAIAYLRTRTEIDSKKIGLIGHSEGGIIAPLVAAKRSDVHFIVMLAGPGIPGNELLLLQKAKIESQMGLSAAAVEESGNLIKGVYEIILASSTQEAELRKNVSSYFQSKVGGQMPESQMNTIVNQLTSPWFIGLLKYNPSQVLSKVKCPVLALNGGKDVQVLAMENLAGIQAALNQGGNRNVKVKEYPSLNHLFQECKTCLVSEYADLEESFSPMVLDDMTAWISATTGLKK